MNSRRRATSPFDGRARKRLRFLPSAEISCFSLLTKGSPAVSHGGFFEAENPPSAPENQTNDKKWMDCYVFSFARYYLRRFY